MDMFKKFAASAFLSDFTLVISNSEPHPAAARPLVDALPTLGAESDSTCLHCASTTNRQGTWVAAAGDGTAQGVGSSEECSEHELWSSRQHAKGCDVLLPADAECVPVHGVVLAAASPVFEALMRNWCGGGQRLLHMVVAEEQRAAAHVLLEYMYTSTIPPGINQMDLLQLLLLADRYDVSRCVAACVKQFAALSASGLEFGALLAMYALPEVLLDSAVCECLRSKAWERLLGLFGDLEDVWDSADGRTRWCQLPFRAVLALARSDEMRVASENTTFRAISMWVATHSKASGGCCDDPEARALAAAVRLPFLNPSYLSFVVMQHAWFRSSVDPLALARAAAFAGASASVRKDLASHLGASTATSASSSATAASSSTATAEAVAPAPLRPRRPSALRACCFDWHVELGAIKALYDDVAAAGMRDHRVLRSPCHAFAGYEWSLQLEITQTRGATGFDSDKPWALGVFLTCMVRNDAAATAATATSTSAAAATSTLCSAPSCASLSGSGGGAAVANGSSSGGVCSCSSGGSGGGAQQQQDGSSSNAAACGHAASGAPKGSIAIINGAKAPAKCCAAVGSCATATAAAATAPPDTTGGGGGKSGLPTAQPLGTTSVASQQQLDFGFVPTSATISARKASQGDESSAPSFHRAWEHALVRHRASWGWPNMFMDVQCLGWEDNALGDYLVGPPGRRRLSLSASVKVLG